MRNSLTMTHALLFTLIISMFLGGSTNAATEPIEFSVTFNTPGVTGHDTTTIEDKVLNDIEQAVPGSTIRIALYIFTRLDVAKALLKASERGVDVALVLDGRNRPAPGNAVDLLMNGDKEHPALHCSLTPCVHLCYGPIAFLGIHHGALGNSCRGIAVNHNKFFLFSEMSDSSRNVVVQSSANIEEPMLHRYNDLLEIKGDEKLFNGYMDYWASLRRGHLEIGNSVTFVGDSGVTAFTSPRLFGSDPVIDTLKHVSCELPGSTIRVIEADFTRNHVAQRLKELEASGCKLEILAIYDPTASSPSKKVVQTLGSSMKLLTYRKPQGSSFGPTSIHAKVILIDAAWDHSAAKVPTLLTGSHNLDTWSLRTNDEVLLLIHNQEMNVRYTEFWYRLLSDVRDSNLVLKPSLQ